MKVISNKKRWINTCFWTDPWIYEDLDPLQKLLFLYLLSNDKTTIAGVYEIPIGKIADETRLTREQVKQFLGDFEFVGKVRYVDNWLILRNTLKHQKGESKDIQRGIDRILDALPTNIREIVETFRGQSIDSPPKVPTHPIDNHPYLDLDLDLDSDLDSDSSLPKNSKRIPKKNGAPPAPLVAVVPATRTVYHLFEQAFTCKHKEFDFKREGPHIKSLEEKALARASPEDFAKMLLVAFWQLIHSEDKFWRKQPFLPSILDSSGIWPRVLKQLENAQADAMNPEVQEIIRGLWK